MELDCLQLWKDELTQKGNFNDKRRQYVDGSYNINIIVL